MSAPDKPTTPKTAKSISNQSMKTAASFTPVTAKTPSKPVENSKEEEKDLISDADPDSGVRSIRVKNLDVGHGEALQECSTEEWEKSESAYDAELLNVKKKKNKVTVFAAPEKSVEVQNNVVKQPSTSPTEPQRKSAEVEDPSSSLARMIEGIAKEFLANKSTTVGVEVCVSMKLVKEDENKKVTTK